MLSTLENTLLILWSLDAKSLLTGKDTDAGQNWGQKEKGTAEDEMVREHHLFNGHEFEQTSVDSGGWRSLVCYSPRGCKESDSTEHTCINAINRRDHKSQLRKGVCFPCEFLALPQLFVLCQRIPTNMTLIRDGWPSEAVHIATAARLHALTKILKVTRTSTRCQSQAR